VGAFVAGANSRSKFGLDFTGDRLVGAMNISLLRKGSLAVDQSQIRTFDRSKSALPRNFHEFVERL
jgi:hypothetical protein